MAGQCHIFSNSGSLCPTYNFHTLLWRVVSKVLYVISTLSCGGGPSDCLRSSPPSSRAPAERRAVSGVESGELGQSSPHWQVSLVCLIKFIFWQLMKITNIFQHLKGITLQSWDTRVQSVGVHLLFCVVCLFSSRFVNKINFTKVFLFSLYRAIRAVPSWYGW